MQSDHQKDQRPAALGSLGGNKRRERLSPEERSAIAKLGAQARHHPLVFQAERERAQRQAYLIQQILKDDKQLPVI